MRRPSPDGSKSVPRHDVIIVGAGFAGLYMLYKVRNLGLSAVVFERGPSVGGTWYWNNYPGARCDVESLQYSYSFSEELQQEWKWSERYASQGEILRYINHVADRFDLRGDIRLDSEVDGATFDEAGNFWRVRLASGEIAEARFLITAAGCLSRSNTPPFPGLAEFEGEVLHTGDWPKPGISLAGKRVGVFGTGSSGIQVIPALAPEVGELYVFQRSAAFSLPSRNRPMDPEREKTWKATYAEMRAAARLTPDGTVRPRGTRSAMSVSPEERRAAYEERWADGGPAFMQAFTDIMTDEAANATAADFVREKIRQTVRDPKKANKLIPTGYPIGAKRICLDTNYFEAYNRDNVEVVDLREEPVVRFEPNSIVTEAREIGLDAVVFATGYDAITGALLRIDPVGVGGQRLSQKWSEGPRTYLGLMVHGFPNLFTITGPGSPSVLGNVLVSIEQHVEWVAGCLGHLKQAGSQRMEATLPAEDDWVETVNEAGSHSLRQKTSSWYLGTNIPGKPRAFMPYAGGVGAYRALCEEIKDKGYAGFTIA